MKLYIKQKVFSIGAKFNVYDERQQSKYIVEGAWFSFTSRHTIYDSSRLELVSIRKRPFSFLAKFDIQMDDGKTYYMNSSFRFIEEAAVVKDIGWSIVSTSFRHEYCIRDKNDNIIARISKKWLSWGDTYEIDIVEGIDEVLVLAVVICYDIKNQDNSSVNSSGGTN